MIFLVGLYGVLSAVAAFFHLTHYQFVEAFCVGFLAAAAFIGGRELKGAVTLGNASQKIGRFIYAFVLLAISFYLARRYNIHLFYAVVPGLYWFLFGIGVGFLSDATRNPDLPPRKR